MTPCGERPAVRGRFNRYPAAVGIPRLTRLVLGRRPRGAMEGIRLAVQDIVNFQGEMSRLTLFLA